MSDKPEQIESIEQCLQSAFQADQLAMYALSVNRVPCNQSLADHPQIIVDATPTLQPGMFSVGAIGLINGVLHAAGINWLAAIKFSDEQDGDGRRKIIGFVMLPRQ
jgi:hypothetical protein